MPSPFDGLEKACFDRVSDTMGYDALWIPQDGSKPGGWTAKVLFNNPTKARKLSDVEYDPLNWSMEYHKEYFPRLKTAVDAANTNEVVTIDGQAYYVRMVYTKYDGDSSMAILEIIP